MLLDCLEVGQMITTMSPEFSIAHLLQQFGLLLRRLPKKLRASFPCRAILQISRRQLLQQPISHGKGRGVNSVFCAVASSNRALPTPSRLEEHHPLLHSAHNTSRVALERILSEYADGGRALELQ